MRRAQKQIPSRIRETLQIVRAMHAAGSALAVPGNHEFNALAYATPDGNGDWLRKHTRKNNEQHEATLEQFAGHEDEWRGHLEWFRTLPLWLEMPGLRAVHAAWDARAAARLGSAARMDEALVRAASKRGAQEFRDVEMLLKGAEIPLPEGHFFHDQRDFPRHSIRTKWWLPARGTSYRRIALQPGSNEWEIPELDAGFHADAVPGYAAHERPVFNGHYWLEGEPVLMAPNRPPHSPTPVPVLTDSGAAGARADSLQSFFIEQRRAGQRRVLASITPHRGKPRRAAR